MTLGGNISAGPNTLTVVGAGTTTINGNIICQGGSVTLAGSGTINIAGNINLGSTGNLTDSSSGQDNDHRCHQRHCHLGIRLRDSPARISTFPRPRT